MKTVLTSPNIKPEAKAKVLSDFVNFVSKVIPNTNLNW